MDIRNFWDAVLNQDEKELKNYFAENAMVRWHCTNELFTVSEYIRANCEYPGDWNGEIQRIEKIENTVITVVKVFSIDKDSSFHVVSFIKIEDGLISEMDEYWSDDGLPPMWRRQMRIGKPIHS